ncbi:hypothetical protein A1O3_00170 [Capronia epimyces CBS 606.96]|uniref:Transcription factor domain-containing protein n=1 Tax=Capronia epimyces CBS 606.96 TaxID=1182542 RepID=W9YPL7_9EURO|nr:uncharacterized protein A1O3_00170 [Capronia epimyces CBS 606.96]EXJ91620.1 hypothetical protein A1O3_00170 [Capronia epimyces CBS 606.96]
MPEADIQRKRDQGYKRVRWKRYGPSKPSPGANAGRFVYWHPVGSGRGRSEPPEGHDHFVYEAKGGRGQTSQSTAPIPSPVQRLPSNGTRVDPFVSLPINATECVKETMDYFVTICKGTNREVSVNPHLSLLLPFALKHSTLFESIIALCRASILLSSDRPAWEDAAFIRHRGNALAGLNIKLRSKDSTDDAALLTVSMLMTLEYIIGNQHGVHMHSEGLEKMLQLRGPLSQTDDPSMESDWIKFVKLGLTLLKSLGSFVKGQPPEVPECSPGYIKEAFEGFGLDLPLSYPEHPYVGELCTILSRLPNSLSDLCLKSRISTQMINLLASISAATALSSSQTSPDGMVDLPSAEESRPQKERREIMIQTLWSSLQRMYLTTTAAIESHFTSGLLAFMFQLRGFDPLSLFYDPILRNFIQTLRFHQTPSTPEERHCLIWTSVSVAGALALRTSPMPDSHTVMDYALESYSDARQWSLLEKILRGFFWTEKIGAHWKNVWELAMDRRLFLLRQRRTGHASLTSRLQGRPAAVVPQFAGEESSIRICPEQVRGHIAGAPKAMHEMTQAMGLCPFRS